MKRPVYQDDVTWAQWVDGSAEPAQKVYSSSKGIQYTESPYTQWNSARRGSTWRQVAARNHFDLGGNFYTFRPFGDHVEKWSGFMHSGLYNFRGDLVAAPIPSQSSSAGLSGTERAELFRRGGTAVKRSQPLNPVVDGATALGEFRKDGLAKVPGMELLQSKGKQIVRKTGSEYLNVEFALKPLISDLKGLYKAAGQQEQLLAQLHRDSGKLIRRRYTFPTERTETTDIKLGAGAVPQPALVSGFYGPGAWVKTTTTVVTKTYTFAGAFTYHLPKQETAMAKMRVQAAEANRLYGIRITPEVLYNLTPWSWALDWVTNTGDLLSNVSSVALDGLVLAYGYIMCHTTSETTVTCEGGSFKGGASGKYVTRYGFESKSRVKATPFGFGLDPALFNARQWSIIGALGLTKAPKVLP